MRHLTVNVPSKPPGHPVEVHGFGVFENGTKNEIEGDGDDIVVVPRAEVEPPSLPPEDPPGNDDNNEGDD